MEPAKGLLPSLDFFEMEILQAVSGGTITAKDFALRLSSIQALLVNGPVLDEHTLSHIYYMNSNISKLCEALIKVEEETLRMTQSLDLSLADTFQSLSIKDRIFQKEWLLQNLHNPYPARELRRRFSKLSGDEEKSIESWFASARSRIGWTNIVKQYFKGSRHIAIDFASRVLLSLEDQKSPKITTSHKRISREIEEAFLSMRSKAFKLFCCSDNKLEAVNVSGLTDYEKYPIVDNPTRKTYLERNFKEIEIAAIRHPFEVLKPSLPDIFNTSSTLCSSLTTPIENETFKYAGSKRKGAIEGGEVPSKRMKRCSDINQAVTISRTLTAGKPAGKIKYRNAPQKINQITTNSRSGINEFTRSCFVDLTNSSRKRPRSFSFEKQELSLGSNHPFTEPAYKRQRRLVHFTTYLDDEFLNIPSRFSTPTSIPFVSNIDPLSLLFSLSQSEKSSTQVNISPPIAQDILTYFHYCPSEPLLNFEKFQNEQEPVLSNIGSVHKKEGNNILTTVAAGNSDDKITTKIFDVSDLNSTSCYLAGYGNQLNSPNYYIEMNSEIDHFGFKNINSGPAFITEPNTAEQDLAQKFLPSYVSHIPPFTDILPSLPLTFETLALLDGEDTSVSKPKHSIYTHLGSDFLFLDP
ncbi:HD1 homeodomain mating-type protein [Pyrrhoderma noxium]|uniref:HD1 homeodomain mating-type protein n=1 Tax=Pyrrhoderma noxium TaxID=2282107 RepID=A0A286USW0_9AGAM|nr:HD1 homeodomain mating-type protein [Pyrrhoderma noxium]